MASRLRPGLRWIERRLCSWCCWLSINLRLISSSWKEWKESCNEVLGVVRGGGWGESGNVLRFELGTLSCLVFNGE